MKKKLARRQKRAVEKASKNKEIDKDTSTMDVDSHEDPKVPTMTDSLVPYTVVRPSGKTRSFSFPQESQSTSTSKTFSVRPSKLSMDLTNFKL